jgi:hypothetical protein
MATQTHPMEGTTTVMPLELSNGNKILIEATFTPNIDETDEGFGGPKMPSMKKIADATESIGSDLVGALQHLEPDKGSVELGFQVSGEAGIPLLTKGTAQANITVTLEWDKASAAG